MKDLNGISLIKFPLLDLERIGTLFFLEFPTTVIYSDQFNNPVIQEWVDCSDDSKVDRYFYYKTSKHLLKDFTNKKCSHLDLIFNSLDGLLYFQDMESNEIRNQFAITPKQLPVDYKPDASFYFDRDDAVDLDKINEHFQLDDLQIIHINETIKEVATNKKTETISLRLNSNEGIGYGKIDSEILGNTLISFNELYKNVGLDYYMGITRGEAKNSAAFKEKFKPAVNTEYLCALAASFVIVLKPKISNLSLFDDITSSETIIQRVYTLIENSKEIVSLKDEYVKHSDITMNYYKQFLVDIKKQEIKLDFYWYSPNNRNELSLELSYNKANSILEYIDNLNVINEEQPFKLKVKFREINLNTSHFILMTLDEEEYSGYFDKIVQEGSHKINFIDIYTVTIQRKITKVAGKLEPTILDKIIGFVLDQD